MWWGDTFTEDREPAVIHSGGDPTVLVVALHSAGSSGEDLRCRNRFDIWATRDGAVVIYPNGCSYDGPGFHWNGGRCCGGATADDVTYLANLIRWARNRWPVEQVAVYGQSNGAVMGYRLACEQPGLIDRMAVRSGLPAIDHCDGLLPPTLHWHGRLDDVIPPDGGQRFMPLWKVRRLGVTVRVLPQAGHTGPFPGWPARAWKWMTTDADR